MSRDGARSALERVILAAVWTTDCQETWAEDGSWLRAYLTMGERRWCLPTRGAVVKAAGSARILGTLAIDRFADGLDVEC